MKTSERLVSRIGCAFVGAAAVLTPYFSGNADATSMYQVQAKSPTAAVASTVFTKEFRDDVGATDDYDPGLDFLLDVSTTPGDQVYAAAQPHGANDMYKTEYDLVRIQRLVKPLRQKFI